MPYLLASANHGSGCVGAGAGVRMHGCTLQGMPAGHVGYRGLAGTAGHDATGPAHRKLSGAYVLAEHGTGAEVLGSIGLRAEREIPSAAQGSFERNHPVGSHVQAKGGNVTSRSAYRPAFS